jgi:hypothetical protein
MNSANLIWVAILASDALAGSTAVAAEKVPGAAEFRKNIRPILETICFDCPAEDTLLPDILRWIWRDYPK